MKLSPYNPRRGQPIVKICCIASLREAELAIRHGAMAVGLVAAMPSGPGVIAEETIAEIARSVESHIGTFLLTSHVTAEDIIAQHRRCGTTTIQICDYVDTSVYRSLREELPGVKLVQVIHVTGPESVDLAKAAVEHVDGLLLDSGNTGLEVKELGGTGRVHDWTISRKICSITGKPVLLAGGLTPDNVGKAVRTVQPFGLDLCSGVRSHGKLDPDKLAAFFAALKEAV